MRHDRRVFWRALLLSSSVVVASGSAAADSPASARDAAAAPHEARIRYQPLEFAGVRPRAEGRIAALAEDEALGRWNLGGSSDPNHAANRPGFHPGTRVLVDTQVLSRRWRNTRGRRGRFSSAAVVSQFRSQGYWRFRGCYEQVARQEPEPGGQTRLRVTLGARGTVIATRLLSSKLRHRQIAQCLRRELSEIRVSPGPRRRTDVDVSISLWPGDVPLPPLPLERPPAPQLDLTSLTRDLEPTGVTIAQCLEQGINRDPQLWGRLELRFSLDFGGTPQEVAQGHSHFPDPLVVGCAERALSRATLPPSKEPAHLMWVFLVEPPQRVDASLEPGQDRIPSDQEHDASRPKSSEHGTSGDETRWVDRDSNPGPTD